MADENGKVTTNELWDKMDRLEERILRRMDLEYTRLNRHIDDVDKRVDEVVKESRLSTAILAVAALIGGALGIGFPKSN